MKAIVCVLILSVVTGGMIVFYVFSWPQQVPSLSISKEGRLMLENLNVQEPTKKIASPDPLRVFQPAPSPSLSVKEVFDWTNTFRQEAGLPPLKANEILNQIANLKIKDMFERQYFAHVSPLGVGIADLAEGAGYEFIAIGENLALGNYGGNQALVQAWMDSPGHRANILDSRYTEIGIALGEGAFEKRSTWFAVQVFALPLSACDTPNENVKEIIELQRSRFEELAWELDQKREELEGHRMKFWPALMRKVEEYNALVDQYNNLVASMRENVNQYNRQVEAFNDCAQL